MSESRPHLLLRWLGPGTKAFAVAKRTAIGTYNDGFIHAGNLAYLAMLAIFPFFILGAALFSLTGGDSERVALINAVLAAAPPTVAKTIAPVARDVMEARSGTLLWIGAGIALWTVSSLIETIRDILRRAYHAKAQHAFWRYRLASIGIILAAVILLIMSLFAQVMIGTSQQIISANFPQLADEISALQVSRIVPALALYLSLYVIFYTLTPSPYRQRRYRKWPGALFTTLWWLTVATLLPIVLRSFFTYDLTYGSLAGIMVALFFFWLVGLGVVMGAELNAALAIAPQQQDDVGACDDAALDRETQE